MAEAALGATGRERKATPTRAGNGGAGGPAEMASKLSSERTGGNR